MRRAMNLILETGNFGHYFLTLACVLKIIMEASCTDFIAGSAGRGKFFFCPMDAPAWRVGGLLGKY